jgi:peptide-methionine (S)-S-oxide reductase
MKNYIRRLVALTALLIAGAASSYGAEQKAVFAGGCFWGVEAVFEHVKGVIAVRSGYAGGTAKTANYEDVSSGETGHAESVEVRFDPAKVTYEQLLNVFFVVAHDPTEVNRQGPDTGTQYRSAIFYSNASQQKAAKAFIAALDASKAFDKPVATEVVPLVAFFEAEEHHQDYLRRNPDDPYIVHNDLPKIEELKKKFPALYVNR